MAWPWLKGSPARAGELLHAQLAGGWGMDAGGAALLRTAPVLSADHELKASSFTVRCVASTGATLEACLGAVEIFAVARSVDWIAHALEQRQAEALIRPRAQYTGPRPEATARGRMVRMR